MIKYYVYCHIRKDTNAIFYVGKGVKRRITASHRRTKYWKNIVNKAGGFTVQIDLETYSEQEALDFECVTIKRLRDSGINLCNVTTGGECGSSGYKHSPETLELMRKNSIGNKSRTGQKFTEEQKQRHSQSLMGRIHSEATKEKISTSMTGLKRSEQAKINMSIARSGVLLSDIHKENIRKATEHKMKPLIVCGRSFDSVRMFARLVNTSHVNIMRWLNEGRIDKLELKLQGLTQS